jgi:hypothetical protein
MRPIVPPPNHARLPFLLLPLVAFLAAPAPGGGTEVGLEVGLEVGAAGDIVDERLHLVGTRVGMGQRRRTMVAPAVTGIRDHGDQDYLFKDQREHLCAGVNEVREHFHTVDYDSLATGTRGEVCSTNGTELKKDIETGPDTLYVVLPKGREIDLSPVGAVLIRQGQTVHLRANNGSTSINGGNATRHFVVHGTLIAHDLVFVNGNSRVTAGTSGSWTVPPVQLGAEPDGGSIRLAGGRSRTRLSACTFYNNNMNTATAGRDIWSEGELELYDVSFAPGWDNAPQPVRNDGTVEVFPREVWDMDGAAMRI